MRMYKRPEMETDPDSLPGQIINRPPQAMFLRDVIERIEASEERLAEYREECCHKTFLEGYRCEGCPYGDSR